MYSCRMLWATELSISFLLLVSTVYPGLIIIFNWVETEAFMKKILSK